MDYVIETKDLAKEYLMGEVKVEALKRATFKVAHGDFVVILGPSGSGKSTLLNIIGGMDEATNGEVYFKNENISSFSQSELTNYRRYQVGFVFQFYNLMANLTARENVELATEIAKDPLDIDEVFSLVGLLDRIDHFPSQLSGGEQQRVAIARAVCKNPEMLLCDEPTGALDYDTGKKILRLLRDINRDLNKTVLVITHNSAIGKMADRVIRMRSGEIIEDYINKQPLDPEEIEW